jgi:hypothetical protein
LLHRLLAVLGIVALLAACGGEAAPIAEETPTPTPEPTEEATPEPEPEPEPTDEPTEEPIDAALAPLTGLPLEDPEAVGRPVLALKIDNAPAARPQQHLHFADVVIEELVEGGTTRFIALYHSRDPGPVGPVRSGREVDADLLPAFQPVLGSSGAAPEVLALFRAADITSYAEGELSGAFFRDPERRAPHNVFANLQPLWDAAGDLPPAASPWPIGPADGIEDAPEATEVALRFPAHSASWTWDDDLGEWLREQGGAPHVVTVDEQLAAANVVVMLVDVRPGSRRDASGTPTVDIDVLGEGDALVLRDGRAIEARWRKESQSDQLEWLTADGEPLPLAPGRTWIELLPTDGGLDVTEVSR